MSSPVSDGTATADFATRVAAVVAAIPAGTVATYGEVAVEAGYPVGASRSVGAVLRRVEGLPWWRVVTASGRLVPGIEDRHGRLLAAEGVDTGAGRVKMAARAPVSAGGQPGARSRRARSPRAVATPPPPTVRSPGRRG